MSDFALAFQLLIHKAEDRAIKLDARFTEDTTWLAQALMAELCQAVRHASIHKELLWVDHAEKRDTQPDNAVGQSF